MQNTSEPAVWVTWAVVNGMFFDDIDAILTITTQIDYNTENY